MSGTLVTCACLAAWIAFACAAARGAEAAVAAPAGPRAFAVTFACAALAAAAAFVRPGATAPACAVACSALVVAAFADARTGYLFDAVTLPAAVLTAALAVAAGAAHAAVLGVAMLVGAFGALAAGSRGRLIGLGDVKAMYAIGAAFGPLEAGVAIFAACACGIATAAVAGRFARGREVRFGPHLAAGAVVAAVAGSRIVQGAFGP